MMKISTLFNSLDLYKKWLTFAVVLMVILGIVPLSFILYRKIKLIYSLQTRIDILNERYYYVDDTYSKVLKLGDSIDILEKNQTENFVLHTYMVDLFQECIRAGFELDRFSPRQVEGSPGYDISLKLWGIGDVDELVANINSMEIATTVESVSVAIDDGRADVSLKVSVLNNVKK